MGARGRLQILATHQYVEDPELISTLDTWVKLLAEAMGKRQIPVDDFSAGAPAWTGEVARRR